MAVSSCDICGKPAVQQAVVEGARVAVCDNCSSFGKVVPQKKVVAREIIVARDVFVADDYGNKVSGALSARGLSVADAAKNFFINEGYLKQIAAGERKPDEKVAVKLEKELGITLLTETIEETKRGEKKSAAPGGALTLGDVVMIKKK